MTTAQVNNSKSLKEIQEDCIWLVDIGAMDKLEATLAILKKAQEILANILKDNQKQEEEFVKWAEKEYAYMVRGEN